MGQIAMPPVPDDGGPADPVPMRRTLDRLLDHLTGAPMAATTSVFEGWAELVGEGVAAHTRPLRLRDGVLTIGVDDPAWASQLRFLEGDLLDRLASAPGGDAVTQITFQVVPTNRSR
jgi:predicted nucleic acid-binding Zn ribbon protein